MAELNDWAKTKNQQARRLHRHCRPKRTNLGTPDRIARPRGFCKLRRSNLYSYERNDRHNTRAENRGQPVNGSFLWLQFLFGFLVVVIVNTPSSGGWVRMIVFEVVFEVVFEFTGAATFEVALDLAGAATFYVAVIRGNLLRFGCRCWRLLLRR